MAVSGEMDLIVLGSGQAGNPLAAAFAKQGKKVAVIERAAFGGTCGNYGCTPTKTMVASAAVAYTARHGAEYGVDVPEVAVEMAKVRERKRGMVKMWREGSEKRLASVGVEMVRGEGSFSGPQEVLVRLKEGGERRLTANVIVIDTGLSPASPPVEGIEEVPYLDNVSIMELDTVPQHLVVLGGGYVGLEFAQMFRRFGSRVTVIQRGKQLLAQEDADVAEEIAKILREDGVEVLLETTAEAVAQAGNGVTVRVRAGDGSRAIEGSHLLAATGRTPNTAVLNLKASGVEMDGRGFIRVNERLETTAKGIYAAGDVTGGPAFTHISYDDYRILKTNLLDGGSRTTEGRLVPYCVFIDPQLGRVGLSEQQAKAEGRRVKVAKMPFSSVARAIEVGRTRGFLKAVVDGETEQILGATVLGEEGGEIMSMLEIAMMGKVKYSALRDGIFAHPLYAEGFNNLFSSVKDA